MRTSRSVESALRRSSRALLGRVREVLPLPEAGDWRPADGWLGAGVMLLAVGLTGAVLSVWAHVAPHTAPAAARLLPLAGVAALAEAVVGGAHALHPHGEIKVWRSLTIAVAVVGAILCDPAGARARLWLPWLIAAAMLGMAMRVGEVMSAALAPTLHELSSGGATPPPSDRTLRSTWGLIMEAWLVAAGAAALGGPGPHLRLAVVAAAMGGALLAAGAQLSVLRASWVARGFAVTAEHVRAHWGLALTLAAGVTALALAVPLPAGPLSERVVRSFLAAASHVTRKAAATGVGRTHVPPPPRNPGTAALRLTGAMLGLAHLLVAEFVASILALLVGFPVSLPLLIVAAVLAVLILRHPGEARRLLGRLLASLGAALAFWRWIRLPRRMRDGLRRMGLVGTPPSAEASAGPVPTAVEWLWTLLDPRAAVRATYRRFLREMAAAGRPRPGHLSPRAFARDLGEGEADGGAVAGLTTAYELARYSDHAADRGWVPAARRGLAFVREVLRAGRRP
jgi:hypothetical protein